MFRSISSISISPVAPLTSVIRYWAFEVKIFSQIWYKNSIFLSRLMIVNVGRGISTEMSSCRVKFLPLCPQQSTSIFSLFEQSLQANNRKLIEKFTSISSMTIKCRLSYEITWIRDCFCWEITGFFSMNLLILILSLKVFIAA